MYVKMQKKRVMTLPSSVHFRLEFLTISDFTRRQCEKNFTLQIKMERKANGKKVIVMFQNDKTAIYEFIFIDHIVFIFTTLFFRERIQAS